VRDYALHSEDRGGRRTDQTTYARTIARCDDDFEKTLPREIVDTIAKTSLHAPVMTIRVGKTREKPF
jgi:hypothetical protein